MTSEETDNINIEIKQDDPRSCIDNEGNTPNTTQETISGHLQVRTPPQVRTQAVHFPTRILSLKHTFFFRFEW
jgi:hypothetical protein